MKEKEKNWKFNHAKDVAKMIYNDLEKPRYWPEANYGNYLQFTPNERRVGRMILSYIFGFDSKEKKGI